MYPVSIQSRVVSLSVGKRAPMSLSLARAIRVILKNYPKLIFRKSCQSIPHAGVVRAFEAPKRHTSDKGKILHRSRARSATIRPGRRVDERECGNFFPDADAIEQSDSRSTTSGTKHPGATRVRTFGEQEFNEIRPVLAGDTGDEGHLAVTVGVGGVFTHAARLVLDRRRVCFRTRGYRNGHDVRRCGLNQTNSHVTCVRDGRVGRSAVDRRARQRVRMDWMDVNSQRR